MKDNVTRRVASHKKVVQIYEALKPVIKVIAEGLCEYIEDYDDEKIALQVGDVSPSSVGSVRRDNWGRLIDHPGKYESTKLLEIRNEIEQLRRALGDVLRKHDLLCSALHTNKVIDAKHLRIEQ
jgi:hypothetical protein